VNLYKGEKEKEIANKSYDRVMEFWPVEYEDARVETSYGSTHIIISGPEKGKPVFLLPGLFADATMWYANIERLSKSYRIYCLDQITFGGKSEPSNKPVKDINDYAVWFNEIVEHFENKQVSVGGLSYGAWLALALAKEIPNKIATVIMLDPSETFIKMDGGIAWKGFWSFAFFPNRKKYKKFFDWLGGGYSDRESDIWIEHMLDVIEYGSVGMFDIPQHKIYHAEDLKEVVMPILIMAGEKPIIYKDPQKFASSAAKALPHAVIKIIPDTGHSMNVEKSDTVDNSMIQFLYENY
jgi:pimeloyl-ACP methyl ester carboxylesterase